MFGYREDGTVAFGDPEREAVNRKLPYGGADTDHRHDLRENPLVRSGQQ